MWRGNKRAQGIRGLFGAFFAKPNQRRQQSRAQGHTEPLEERLVLSNYVPDHVLLGLKPGYDSPTAALANLESLVPGSESRPIGDYGLFLMKLPQGRTVPSAIELLRGQPGIRYAEPDWIRQTTAVPNDPAYSRMWGMKNTGQVVNFTRGVAGADIDAEPAWDSTKGSRNVVVAVIDTGIDLRHPDLAANIWVNPGEIAGNGVDDDNNGYIDDVNGYDFADGDANPSDAFGHGTHVAGTIGAIGDNGIGTVGVNWNVSIMALKGANASGGLPVSATVEALNYAVQMGATVSNHSYGGLGFIQFEEDAIIAAQARGHIVVCAAGNFALDNDIFAFYPASYTQDNVISVAATDQSDDLAGFSHFGVVSVDIGAPGVNVWSTAPTAGSVDYPPNYAFSDGTSMASPHVAGAVALLRSLYPANNYTEIVDAIFDGADPLPSLSGLLSTGARLNLSGALAQLSVASIASNRSSIAENAGNNAAQLTLRKSNFPVDQPLTLEVIVDDPTELTVSGLTGISVTIPAFQRSVSLPVNAIDDTILDGTQTVNITLRFSGADVQTITIDVTDHETLTLTADPTTVLENAGVGAGTLTVTRSNTDVFPPDRVIAVGNELVFFDRQGAATRRVPVPWPAGSRPTNDTVRDVTVMEDGRIAVFNGASTVYVSIYNPGVDTWTHQLIIGATASTTDTGTGGITTSGSIIYISDLQTGTGDPFGIVRFDTSRTGPGAVNRVVTKAFGNRLFGSSWPQSSIYELDPATGAVLKTIASPATGSTMAGMAFDGQYIWYIVDNNNTLYKIDADTGLTVDTFFTGTTTNGSYEGIAWLNGLIYLLDPFITNEIVEFDPVLRAVTRRLQVGQLNVSPGQGGNLNLSGGLTANPSRNSLFVSSTFNNEVYEISASSGLLLRKSNGDPSFFVAGIQAQGMATVGDRLYISEPSGNNKRILIYDFDGNLQSSIPSPFFFSMFGLGSDGVPGLVNSSYRWRDVTMGLDGFLYALDDAAGIVGKFDPVNISTLDFISVPTTTQAIAVDAAGTVFGGLDDGTIAAFDQTGALLRQLTTGVGLISDIEVNATGTVLVSARGGSFGYSTAALTSIDVYSSGTISPAFVSFGEHISKNRAELVVQLTNFDTTEIAVPLTVVIPEGQASVTVPFDAVDDFIRDGAQIVTVTASASGYVPDSEDIVVEDYEGIDVDVIQTSVAENAGANASAVRVRRTDIDGPFSFLTQQNFSNPLTYQLRDRSTTYSPIVVPTQISRVTDVNVTVNFRHDWLGDLDVFLISPKGTRVELFTDLNSNERNMTSTVLDDEANLEIVHGKAPFTGSFMPEGSLSNFDGEEAHGTWQLEVSDDNVSEFGALLGWSLSLSTIGLDSATITLRSVDTTELSFGGAATRQVVIPANQSEVTVFVDAVDDDILDGTQVAQVIAEDVNVPGLLLGGDQTDVTDVENLQFTMSRSIISESDGVAAVIGTLRRFNSDLDLFSLELQTSRSDKLDFTGVVPGLPFLVEFAAGSDTATFSMDAIDNAIIDGSTTVTITVVSPQYGGNLTQQVVVEDQEPRIRITTSTANPREDVGSISITVQRDAGANLGVDLNVDLTTSGSNTALVVPPVVTIPAGQSFVSIPITVLDDTLLGDRTVQITGSAAGLIDDSLDITVLDHETVTITVNRTSFLENAGPRAAVGTVTRSNTDRSLPLVVNLASSDTTELTVPAFVTIPAGLSSVAFDIAAVNDPDLDGAQLVTVSAAATAYFGTNLQITVLDHEPPVLTSPGATTVNPRETIRWNPVPGAVRYDLQLANLSLKIPNYIFRSGLTTTSFTPPENLGIGLWRVWVRAYDQFEVPGFWSVPRDYRVVTAPTVTAPVTTGGVAAATFPDISWTAVADAVRYELWVNNVTAGSTRVIYQTNIQSTTYRALSSMASGTYRAFVRAANAIGEFGNWSLAKEFTVIAQPTVTRPEFISTFDTTPLFEWTAVVGARYYDLYVANRATKAVVIRDQAVVGTSYQATMDLAKGDYTVWVRAVGEKLVSIWSPPKNFTIGGPPTLLNPTANGVVSANHTFSWTAVGDADKYEIWVQRDSDNAVFTRNNISGTSFQFGLPLIAGGYRVWLRVVSIIGERSAWSAPVRFQVASSDTPAPQKAVGNVMLAALEMPLLNPEFATSADRQRKRAAVPAKPVAEAVRELPVEAAVVDSATIHDVDAVMETWNSAEWWLEMPAASPVAVPSPSGDINQASSRA